MNEGLNRRAFSQTGVQVWRSWLRNSTTNQKVADSISDSAIGILY